MQEDKHFMFSLICVDYIENLERCYNTRGMWVFLLHADSVSLNI